MATLIFAMTTVSVISGVGVTGLRWSTRVCDHGNVTDRKPVLPSDRVAAELRARLAAGEWATEDRLPSVAALAAAHNTSRATMTKVLHTLEAEGLVTIVPSWGVFKA